MKTTAALWIALAALLGAFVLPDRGAATRFFIHASYPFLAVLVAAWLVVLVRSLRAGGWTTRAGLRSRAAGLATAGLLAAAVFVSVPPRLRVLADEANLVSVSRSMALDRRSDQITMGTRAYGRFEPLKREIPTRPLLFPFLVHPLHVLTGYRPANAFVLNFAVFAVFLYLAFLVGARLRGALGGAAAAAFVTAQPVVTFAATSAGYDLLFGALMLGSFLAVREYLEDPREPRFRLLWLTLLMLAHTRHEAFLFSGLALGVLAVFRRVPLAHLSQSWIYAATPLLVLPLAVHQTFAHDLMLAFVPRGVRAFGWEHFVRQNGDVLKALAATDFRLPYANAVLLAGIAGLVWAFVAAWRKGGFGRNGAAGCLWSAAALALAAHWAVITSVFWGSPFSPGASRFYLLPCTVLSLGAVRLLAELKLWPPAVVGCAAAALLAYHPIAVKNQFPLTIAAWREYAAVTRHLAGLPGPDFVLVAETPRKYAIYEYGAVSFIYANSKKRELLGQLGGRLFQDIYVLQQIAGRGENPTPGTRLDPAYRLEKVAEWQTTPGVRSRLSRVAR